MLASMVDCEAPTPDEAAQGDERAAALLAALRVLPEEQRAAFNTAQLGATLPVLLEKLGRREGQLIGRSPYLQSVHLDAPESSIGAIADVEITGTTPNALAGRLAAPQTLKSPPNSALQRVDA